MFKLHEMNQPKRSKAQIKQLSLLKAMKRYRALGFAYKMAPKVKVMLSAGLSQREIAKRFTLSRVLTPSEQNKGKHLRPPKSNSVWTQTQVSRLIKDIETVKNKMKWYYIKAFQYNRIGGDVEFEGEFDPDTGKYWKLIGHNRKSALEYYRDKMREIRINQIFTTGDYDDVIFSTNKEVADTYRKLTKLRSYRKAKLKSSTLKSP